MIFIGKIFDHIKAEITNIFDSVELWIDFVEYADLEMHKDIKFRMSEAVMPVYYFVSIIES